MDQKSTNKILSRRVSSNKKSSSFLLLISRFLYPPQEKIFKVLEVDMVKFAELHDVVF